ncbi:MAG TPA: DUF5666 domain-containing protein [Ktedonobacterales bacterium]|nr:DUF5666 domain-containing protein [Ktedonobacterales bacterium]
MPGIIVLIAMGETARGKGMRTFTALLRTRVGIAFAGAVLIGVLGAFVGAASVSWPGDVPGNSGTARVGNATHTAGSSAAGSASATTGTNPSATDTPTGAATAAPTSTTTQGSGGTGQTLDLHGVIGTITVSANTFILNVNGAATTVVVNGQTAYQGSASSLQGLRSGWQAEVKGQYQSDRTFRAFLVNSDSGA